MNWTTKDGREIPIKEMSDSHLLNALRFAKAQEMRMLLAGPPEFNGEQAQLAADLAWDHMNEHGSAVVNAMEDEILRRGL